MRERYLLTLDLAAAPVVKADVLVIGAGVAGLTAAIAAAREGASVLCLCKAGLGDSNTAAAQGGIAAALGEDDGPELHLRDTLEAGCGLCEEAACRRLVTEGPEAVRELISWGAEFDRECGGLALTREGAHSRNRIVHARGDATGGEVARVLLLKAREEPGITFLENHFVADLLHSGGRVHGAVALGDGDGKPVRMEAAGTILASGGGGRLYRETTNPDVTTGDGFALAYRAGAELADIEFVQFHPTALYVAGAPRVLISEAVRGEGGHLINARGARFMTSYHPQAELAPRDETSAAIVEEMAKTRGQYVRLDIRHLDAARMRLRFPQLFETCALYGLDPLKRPIPVRPAAHYFMGGVRADLAGRTSVEGLWACGEVACTGLHGANRLASNSLLEGLVFGRAAGRSAAGGSGPAGSFPRKALLRILPERQVPINLGDVRRSLLALMNRSCGIFREGRELASAVKALDYWQGYVGPVRFRARAGLELQNMLTSAMLVARAAGLREETRGSHRRRDFPERDDGRWRRRVVQSVRDFE